MKKRTLAQDAAKVLNLREAVGMPTKALPNFKLMRFMRRQPLRGQPRSENLMSNDFRIFVPVAIRAVMNRLVPGLEIVTGKLVTQMIDLNPAIPERISAGETYDIGLTNPHHAMALIAAGHADGASHRPFGRVPLAVAQKAASDVTGRTDGKEIVSLFQAAESIAYTGAGTSGRTYIEIIEKMGLTDSVLPKSRAMGGGEPVAAVANGEIEFAIAPLTTVLATPGVVTAAVFPEELGTHIDMSVFMSKSAQSCAALALEYLTSYERDEDLAAAGVLRFDFI